MRIPVFFILLNFLCLAGCVTGVKSVDNQPVYTAALEPGSKLISNSPTSSVERTTDGRYVYKEYYYDTRVVTAHHTYLDARLNTAHGPWRSYYDNGQLKSEGQKVDGKAQGVWKTYDWSDSTTTVITYVDGEADGPVETFDIRGRKRHEIMYKAGKRHGVERWYNDDGSVKGEVMYTDNNMNPGSWGDSDIEYMSTQISPQFPCDRQFLEKAGADRCGEYTLMQYLAYNIQYPPRARDNNVQGKAFARFTVMTDGTIDNIEVVHGLSSDIKAEVERVIRQMPRWKPGEVDGKAVKVRYTLPVAFRLE